MATRYLNAGDHESWLEITDTEDSAELELCVTAAEASIDHHAGWSFDKVEGGQERLFWLPDDPWGALTVTPIAGTAAEPNITSIQVDSDDDGNYSTNWLTGHEIQYEPLNQMMGPIGGWPITEIRPVGEPWPTTSGRRAQVKIVADPWGWVAVPPPVSLGTLILASRFHTRRKSREGVAGFEGSGIVRLDRGEDRDVGMMVHPYSNPLKGI